MMILIPKTLYYTATLTEVIMVVGTRCTITASAPIPIMEQVLMKFHPPLFIHRFEAGALAVQLIPLVKVPESNYYYGKNKNQQKK